MSKEIPIFFSTDDHYIPYLDVALSSLIQNASTDYTYRIIVLNTGLRDDHMAMIKQNQKPGFIIEFFDISGHIEKIRSRFKNLYHFSVVTYYRLFIASIFPQYDKVLYLDCDLVVLGDISELYNVDLGHNILAAVADQHVKNTAQFRDYAQIAIGVEPDKYINAGVLLINLEQFRKNKLEEQFTTLISSYDFDLLDPDQAFLNFLCRNRIHLLPNGWNKAPSELPCEGKKNIVHFALYKKPWQYDDVTDGEYFWHYAKSSPFYSKILENKAGFTAAQRAAKDADAAAILEHANAIVRSGHHLKEMKTYGTVSA